MCLVPGTLVLGLCQTLYEGCEFFIAEIRDIWKDKTVLEKEAEKLAIEAQIAELQAKLKQM